ncbi:VWA domain-containing protein [Stigmatella sp. ncwal1]|uniref:VWA domain-containing protein n=1 Tax=Stigmatella ashevillensis TaxID=2995309 RepID=A0ABT5D250_9BACT|nr:vWA domain-containing protein [Stigmatella ashevillena]MDC0707744.1 VWA domain-containing protein [Stigmatella ashevillena]
MRVQVPARIVLLSALLGWGAACDSPVDRPGSGVPGKCQAEAPVIPPQKTDILFVIDNSGSMKEEQEAIATELPAFLEQLRQGGGVAQDFRVGVITTSVYVRTVGAVDFYPEESGHLRPVPTPGGEPSAEKYIEGADPELLEKFRRLVVQGIRGSGQETPFEAVRLAVADPGVAGVPLEQGGNKGFLRDGARLLVVVVTDEEDCSSTQRPPPVILTADTSRDLCSEQADTLTSVDEYFQIFQSLRDGRGASREVLWATIGPVGLSTKEAKLIKDTSQGTTYVRNVDCPTSYGPGIRQRAMAERFNSTLANLDSICKANYRESLVSIAALAAISQSVEVMNIPDPLLAQVLVSRGDGTVQKCSVAGGDLRYDASGEDRPARLFFLGNCLRKADDQAVEVKLLCAE